MPIIFVSISVCVFMTSKYLCEYFCDKCLHNEVRRDKHFQNKQKSKSKFQQATDKISTYSQCIHT